MPFDSAQRKGRRGWPLLIGSDRMVGLDPGNAALTEHHNYVSGGIASTNTPIPTLSGGQTTGATAATPPPLRGKTDVAGVMTEEMTAEHQIIPICAAHGGAANPTTLVAATAFQHIVDINQTDITFPGFYAQEVDRDSGEPVLYPATFPRAITITAADGGLATIATDGVAEQEHVYEPSALDTEGGSATTAVLYVQGLPRFDLRAPSTDTELFIRVDSIAASVATCSVKIGTASSYGATQSDIPIGGANGARPPRTGELRDSNASGFIGLADSRVTGWFDVSTDLDVGDIFSIDNPRTPWVHAPSTAPRLTASNGTLLLPDRTGNFIESECWSQFSLTINPPFLIVPCAKGAYRRIQRVGKYAATVAFTKEWDSLILDHLKTTPPTFSGVDVEPSFGFRFTLESNEEMSPGFRWRTQIDARNCSLTGSTKILAGDGDVTEASTATCHTSTIAGFEAPVRFTFDNTLSSIAP